MPSVTRKKGVAVKMKKAELGNDGVDTKLEDYLKEHSDDAYTVQGLMIELYGVPPEDIKGSWKVWPRGLPALYGRIRRALDRLQEAGKITCTKHSKAFFWAWK